MRDAQHVLRIDVPGVRIEAEVDVGAIPSAIAIGEGAVWVASYENATVTRVDGVENRRVAVIRVPPKPNGLLAGAGAVWLRGQTPGQNCVRIDPRSHDVSVVEVDAIPLAVSHGAVWIDQRRYYDRSAILRLDPTSYRTTEVVQGDNVWNVTPSTDLVWFTHSVAGRWVLDAWNGRTGVRADHRLPLPADVAAPRWVAVADGALIVGAMLQTATVPRGWRDGPFGLLRIDQELGVIVARAELEEIEDIAVLQNVVCVAQHDRRRLLTVDVRSLEVRESLSLCSHPGAMGVVV
jgi:hypothetical protein